MTEKTELNDREENVATEEAKSETTVAQESPGTANEPTAEATEKGDKTEDKNEKKKCKKSEARIAELEKKLADAEKKNAEDADKYMRLAAEYDNFRRRSAKEKDGIYGDAYASAIKDLLPVLDNLERAVGCDDPKALAEGLALILKSFDEALVKLGIEEIKALGEKFDPDLHYAVLHVEDDSHGENEIIEVLQKGYRKGEKVIRYAVVKVAN